MPTATCHCGAVRLTVARLPEFLIDCNCSICRRNGALWALYDVAAVATSGHPQNTTAYIWGPRSIRTLHCRTCGCVTHWEPLSHAADAGTMGINARNFEPAEISGVAIRKFDGAVSWSYVD